MAVRKLANSWQYDFQIKGYGRQRKAGFRAKLEALEAERRARQDLISGRRRACFAEAYQQYVSATTMKDRSQDFYSHLWPQIEPTLQDRRVRQVREVRLQRQRGGGDGVGGMPLRFEPWVLLAVGLATLALSGVHPHDRTTWLLEVAPMLIGAPLLVATGRRFPLTPLLYRLIFVHAIILMVGGHYTYARVPLGFYAQEWFGFARNHYDRLGHFAQGFIPAMICREILLRRSPLRPGGWLFFLTACVVLAISATYEFIEWWAALAGGEAAADFLGTQGDVWDTQWDMFLALVGACCAQLLLARRQDREIAGLPGGG